MVSFERRKKLKQEWKFAAETVFRDISPEIKLVTQSQGKKERYLVQWRNGASWQTVAKRTAKGEWKMFTPVAAEVLDSRRIAEGTLQAAIVRVNQYLEIKN